MRLLIAGVDEAGRGPLAGPVSVAAVILDNARPIDGLDDSKRLTERKRDALYPLIIERALAWRIEFVEADEIDILNILQATMTGMRRALAGLLPCAGHALIDGNRIPDGLDCPATAIIGGDGLEPAIMAASILAKVGRDARMRELHAVHPEYGFDRHKGYPSAMHLQALALHGPCQQHRRSFGPVRNALALSCVRPRQPPPTAAPISGFLGLSSLAGPGAAAYPACSLVTADAIDGAAHTNPDIPARPSLARGRGTQRTPG